MATRYIRQPTSRIHQTSRWINRPSLPTERTMGLDHHLLSLSVHRVVEHTVLALWLCPDFMRAHSLELMYSASRRCQIYPSDRLCFINPDCIWV